jgi:hypothetical protein
MRVDLSKLMFYSNANYMKRSALCGSEDLTLPSSGSTVTKTVTHNLGYTPKLFQVFTEIDDNDIIWNNTKIYDITETSLTGVSPPDPHLSYWATDNDLVIELNNTTSPTATGTRKVYWLIYLDYDD